jgi:hypothetical protein
MATSAAAANTINRDIVTFPADRGPKLSPAAAARDGVGCGGLAVEYMAGFEMC